MTVEMMNI